MVPRTLTVESDPDPEDLEGALRRLRRLVETSEVPEARRYVKELAVRWPDDERVHHWDRVLEPPRVLPARGKVARSFRDDWGWMREHAHEYPGCWIAVHGKQLIAADPDPQVVRDAVRAHPEWSSPLLHFQPRPGE